MNCLHVEMPAPLLQTVLALAACAVPLGLLLIGAFLEEHLRDPRALLAPRVNTAAVLLRLGVLPVVLLVATYGLPFPGNWGHHSMDAHPGTL